MHINGDQQSLAQHTDNWNEVDCVGGCVQQKIQFQQQLYYKFYPAMMAAVLRYTNDSDEAATILNNGFLRVFKQIQTFKFEGSLEGWIRKIIIHSVSDYFRYKHKPIEILAEQIPDNEYISANFSSKYDYNKLLQVLENLPHTTRIVVNLFIIDNYSHKDIAAMLNISENTSKWHVANGRKLLQEKLQIYYNEK